MVLLFSALVIIPNKHINNKNNNKFFGVCVREREKERERERVRERERKRERE